MIVLAAFAACRSDQGLQAQVRTDTWLQAENNKVDILFVVDDSGSMEEEQATLASGFSTFAAQLEASQTEFHLGVISTSFDYDDPQRGALLGEPRYLTNEDADYAEQFAARAQIGITGNDKEKGLEAAAYAISPLANLDLNGGFSRPDARLLMVFVSDEEDCSDAGALTGREAADCYREANLLVPVSEYVAEFREAKARPEDVQVAAIVGLASEPCEDAWPSDRYTEVARLTGGLMGNICDADWSTMLGDLGLNASGVVDSFLLSRAAIPDTIEVMVDDQPVEDGWSYDAETWLITFEPAAVPARGTQILARYTVQDGQPRPPGAGDDDDTDVPQ